MTAVTQRPAQLIRRSIVDRPETVAARVALVRRSGRLVDMTPPRQLPDGRAHVVVTLLPPDLDRRNDSSGRRRTVIAVAATVGTVVLGAVVYVVYALAQLVKTIAAHAGWIAVGLLLFLCAAVFLRPNHRATCAGLHCPGCKG